MRPKKCKACGLKFQPERQLQSCCSIPCAITLAKATRTRQDRLLTKARMIELKSRSDWLKEAQTVFNKYIRARDKDLPCISCGRFHQGQYHAGHYRSVGACPELRFCEENNHKQCAPCNNHLSGNIVNYRINLIKKIGLDRVEWLEGNHEPKKYTIDEIKQIKAKYTRVLKNLIRR